MNKKRMSDNGIKRAIDARAWLSRLENRYKDEVDIAQRRTIAVVAKDRSNITFERKFCHTDVSVYKNDVVTCAKAAVTHDDSAHVCVLNFASPTNPGGGFLSGAMAQEEALCHATGLYPCLSQESCSVWYTTKKTDDLLPYSYIYTQECPFIVNGKVYCVDVLTMAAVNLNTKHENPVEVMQECQKSAFLIPASYGVDTVLLGAWGCGVFKNDPKLVAEEWDALQTEYEGYYKAIVHPITNENMYRIFREVMQ